eukprot:5765886-Pleurochrysis_carterae.AAC.1
MDTRLRHKGESSFIHTLMLRPSFSTNTYPSVLTCGVGHADERVGVAETQLCSQEVRFGFTLVGGVVLNTRVRAGRGLRVPPEFRGRASVVGGAAAQSGRAASCVRACAARVVGER